MFKSGRAVPHQVVARLLIQVNGQQNAVHVVPSVEGLHGLEGVAHAHFRRPSRACVDRPRHELTHETRGLSHGPVDGATVAWRRTDAIDATLKFRKRRKQTLSQHPSYQ